MYRPRHNGVIVTSGRGVVRGMAVGGGSRSERRGMSTKGRGRAH